MNPENMDERNKKILEPENNGLESDHGNWRNIDMKIKIYWFMQQDWLPIDYQFRKDDISRHFSHAFYIRVMYNGKNKIEDGWFIQIQLATIGYNDWRNVSSNHDHIICMTRWIRAKSHATKNQTIDKNVQE